MWRRKVLLLVLRIYGIGSQQPNRTMKHVEGYNIDLQFTRTYGLKSILGFYWSRPVLLMLFMVGLSWARDKLGVHSRPTNVGHIQVLGLHSRLTHMGRILSLGLY